MKNIHILKSFRLGNFITQLFNAIKIALFYNYNVILPKHEYFNTTYIVINKNVTIDDEKIIDKYNFYYYDKIENIDMNLFAINNDETYKILKECFVFKEVPSLNDNDLLIHIRSGDLFTNKNPHPGYVVPPLSFYVDIINNNKFDKIYLIAEDTINPCINNLLELFPNIIFNLQPLEKDILLILSAKNIVISIGTFVTSLLLFSENIKTVYKPSYFFNSLRDYNFNVKVITTNLYEYKKLLTPWINSKEQHDIILSYTPMKI